MRFLVLFALCVLPLSALAQDKPKPPVPIETFWRSDTALDDAIVLMKDRKWAEALDLLNKITARNMRNADAHVYTAICLANLGDLQRAKNVVLNAMAIDKGHMGAYVVGGMISLAEDDKTRANYYLSAIRIACQSELCPEYGVLKKAILEAPRS